MGCFEKCNKIDSLIWGVFKSEYIKQKKQVFMLKQIEIFPLTDANALRYMGFYYYFKYLVFTINITEKSFPKIRSVHDSSDWNLFFSNLSLNYWDSFLHNQNHCTSQGVGSQPIAVWFLTIKSNCLISLKHFWIGLEIFLKKINLILGFFQAQYLI